MIKPDTWIREMASSPDLVQTLDDGTQVAGMIYPFSEKVKGQGIVSYGLDSYGYDCRVAPQIAFPSDLLTEKDPKDPILGTKYRSTTVSESFLVPPNGGEVLVATQERFKIPAGIQVRSVGKSTYTARLGLLVTMTDIEPGYEGVLTCTLVNPTKVPIRVYVGEGFVSLKFQQGESDSEQLYAGAYQNSNSIQVSKTKE